MDQNFRISSIFNKSGSKVLKFCWIVVLCGSVWGLGYYVSENYIKLNINPEVLVKARYVNSRTIPFPAITICPPYPIKMEILNITKFFDDLENGIIPNVKDRRILTGASHVCSNYYNKIKALENKIHIDDNIVNILNEVSPKMDDIIDRCSIFFHVDCRKILIQSLTYQGNCFTFNMLGYHSIFNANISADFDGYKRKNISKSWDPKAKVEYHDDDKIILESSNWTIQGGYSTNEDWVQPLRASGLQSLKLTTKISTDEYPNFCKNNFHSFRVILHLPNEIPSFFNILSRFNLETFKYIKISAEIVKIDENLMKFPTHKRNCFVENERKLRFFKSYSKLNCEHECMTNYTYKKCGCVGFPLPRTTDMKVCEFEKSECFTYIYYYWATSYYEDDYYMEKFPDFPCNCLPTCTMIQYNLVNEYAMKLEKESPNYTTSSLQIAFGDSQILETTHYITYKVQNFVSDVGGLAGLFLGFSLLSLFELIVKVFAAMKKMMSPCSCKKMSERESFSKSRKRKNRKFRRKVEPSTDSTPDVVVIDMIFGEQVEAEQ